MEKKLQLTYSSRALLDSARTDSSIPNLDAQHIPLFNLSNISNLFSQYVTYFEIGYQVVIESLDAVINISSIAPAILANIFPEDTLQEKLVKIRAIDDKYPKMGLSLYLKDTTDSSYVRKFSMAMQNQQGEYYQPLLNNFTNAANAKPFNMTTNLYVSVDDLGYGTLRGSDYVNVDCTASIYISLLEKTLLDVGETGTITITTPTLNPGDNYRTNIVLAKIAYLLTVTTNGTSRFRCYTDAASRESDIGNLRSAYRVNYVVPGLVCDVSFGSGVNDQGVQISNLLSAKLRPSTIFINQESPQTTFAPLLITNTDTIAKTITLSLTYTVVQR